jgi:hypothetical protein
MMIVISVYCAGRLVASRLWHRQTEVDADGLHAVMGAAMAGMLVPQLSTLPGSVWRAVFGVAAAWFAWQAARARHGSTTGGWRSPHPVPHLVECGAMLYMLMAVPGSRPAGPATGMAMPRMSTSPGAAGSFPALAVVLALFMLLYVVWATDQLTSMARARPAPPAQTAARYLGRVPAIPGGLAAVRTPDPADAAGVSGADGTRHRHPARRPGLGPRLAACYKIAMGIAMGYMLIVML